MHRKRKSADRRRVIRRMRVGAGFLTLLVTLCLVLAGTTLAVFSASRASGTESFTAGQVTLASSAIANCPVTGLLPNATPQTCTFTATYSGTTPAYLAARRARRDPGGHGRNAGSTTPLTRPAPCRSRSRPPAPR